MGVTIEQSWPSAVGRRGGRVRESTSDHQLLEAALAGQPGATRELVERLTPVVQVRVSRVLWRYGRVSHQRNLREEVWDLSQEMFALLFSEGARILKAWDPNRGVSLAQYVGVVVTRRSISIMRSARRNPWQEDPVAADIMEGTVSSAPRAETDLVARDLLQKAHEAVFSGLSEKGKQLYVMLVQEDRDVAEVVELSGMSPAAVYQWRSRLMKQLRTAAQDASAPRRSAGGRA